MSKHLQRELDRLKRRILSLSGLAEESVHKAVHALERRDERLAANVIESDIELDHAEVDLEEECLKILALHQPVAIDLRFIVACLKINNDLERIGDLAVNVAERAQYIATHERVDAPFDFVGMAEKAQAMVRESLDALVNLDAEAARRVCAADDEVDALNREMYAKVQDGIRAHPEQMPGLIHLLSASRHLERIADHATNIAEDVIYMVKGEIVRHQAERYKRSP
ncbi:MAG: PhoU family transcriptional regulator [Planctomycetes bacterium SM23_32]|nr:MAG: PhoU family transcriptional regulator [Planctomycetes bacterium SM23_32]